MKVKFKHQNHAHLLFNIKGMIYYEPVPPKSSTKRSILENLHHYIHALTHADAEVNFVKHLPNLICIIFVIHFRTSIYSLGTH